MKVSLIARFWCWFCDVFGHEKSGRRNAEWYQYGRRHYQCVRCRRVITMPYKV